MRTEMQINGTEIFPDGSLTEIFFNEIQNRRMAWYIDYYTEDLEQFHLRYLASREDLQVELTNENKEMRDNSDPDAKMWGSDEVAKWFKPVGDEDLPHKWLLIFEESERGQLWGLHVAPYQAFAFGPEFFSLPSKNLWEEYVEDGLLGVYDSTGMFNYNSNLKCILVDPCLKTLDTHSLVQSWLKSFVCILGS